MKRTVALMAAAAIVSHALARSTYPILLPAMAEDLVATNQLAGALTTINFGGYLIGVLAVTTISGRAEPARLLIAGLALAAVGFVLLTTATSYALLAIGLGLTGLGSAGIWMSAPVLATAAVSERRRGTVMGLLSSSMGFGIVATSQGTNAIRATADDPSLWRPTWGAAAVFAAVVLVLVISTLRLPPTARVPGGLSLTQLRSVPDWLPLMVAYWCFGIVSATFVPFFGAALEEAGFGRSHVGNLYTAFGLSAVAGAVGLGRVSDHIGRRPVLVGAITVMSGASLLVLTEREPFATVAAVGFGAASFTFPVLVTAYLSDHLQGRAFANALGTLTLFYGTALVIGPLVAGSLADSQLGFPAVFVQAAVLAAAAALILLRVGGHGPERPHDGVTDTSGSDAASSEAGVDGVPVGRDTTAATAPSTTKPPNS